jgi:hypothetical protein
MTARWTDEMPALWTDETRTNEMAALWTDETMAP